MQGSKKLFLEVIFSNQISGFKKKLIQRKLRMRSPTSNDTDVDDFVDSIALAGGAEKHVRALQPDEDQGVNSVSFSVLGLSVACPNSLWNFQYNF